MRVLLVEDDPLQCNIVAGYIRRAGHEVDTASCRDSADELMAANSYDVAAIDLVLTVSTGDTVAQRAYRKGMGVVLMSATTEKQLADVRESIELQGSKVHHTLKKPFTPAMLIIAIEDAYRQKMADPPPPEEQSCKQESGSGSSM